MSSSLPFPAFHASHSGFWIASDGKVFEVSRAEAIKATARTPHIMLNAPLTANRLGMPELAGLDLLELYAFIHPARFIVPMVKALAAHFDITPPEEESQTALFLIHLAERLLETLKSPEWPEREGAFTTAQALMRADWPWAQLILPRLKTPQHAERWLFSKLDEWEERPPRPAPRNAQLTPEDTLGRLEWLKGPGAEQRSGQRDYTLAAAQAFEPRIEKDVPQIVLAEAGTGIGKTLGYLAPASLWAEKANGAVWISTFTKTLQRQLSQESQRLFPDPKERAAKIVVRKGRENYLCLLNLEDALQGGFTGRSGIFAHLVARWAAYSKDGDMVGGDLPAWLITLFRRSGATALTDRRGECVYAGCPHYRKCFIERATRDSAHANIVISNHALVMVNAVRGRETAELTRYVFDEGHRLFDAADSLFAYTLSGSEAIEIRRWIIGPETEKRGRRRGLAARLADVASYDSEGSIAMNAAVKAAQALPGDGWLKRINADDPFGPIETLLHAVRAMVYARDANKDEGYGLETECTNLTEKLLDALPDAQAMLNALIRPLMHLRGRLEAVMAEAPDWMDGVARARIEGAFASLSLRIETLSGWLSLLTRLTAPVDPDFVDWLSVERHDGREFDIGINRRWLDPMRPFATTVLEPAHGALITSATLRFGNDWEAAKQMTGTAQAPARVSTFLAQSPFDYAAQAKVLIVNDITKGDLPALALAYARLIEASEGGALGLFTSIRRLRQVNARIIDHLNTQNLPLYAQHVDPMDTGTLVDIFRADARSTLLGTDALRDGVDVPGEALRLVIMEGVPWVKPTILHAARRAAFGGNAYAEQLVRIRLAQAFGRLVRRAEDKGIFVMLSAAMPSRLLSAFPTDTPKLRVTLDEAVRIIKNSHTSLNHPQATVYGESR